MSPLKTKRLNDNYGCSQKDLYEVVQLVLKAYQDKRARFSAISTIYTEEWGDNLLDAMLAAKAMPEKEARSQQHEALRIRLLPVGDSCCINWKLLESHIFRSFPVEEHKTMLESAGRQYYRRATKKDWESVSALMQMAGNFIADNLARLTGGGMPASFESDFGALTSDFEAKYTEFKMVEQQMEEAREAKIEANNAVYTTLIGMMKDGQKIFRNEAAVRERFVFRRVLADIGTS